MKKIGFVMLCLLMLGACKPRKFNDDEHGSHTLAAPSAVHGMIIFGNKHVFASHIPMIGNAAHKWQALFEISLNDNDRKTYLAKQDNSSRSLVTVQPSESFPLPAFIDGSKKSFAGRIFFGNFEAGTDHKPQKIQVTRISTLSDQILPFASGNNNLLYYFLADEGQNGFLVHRISDKGTFDQILSATVDKPVEAQGLQKIEIANRTNEVSKRLRKGEEIPSALGTIKVGQEISCLTGPGFGPSDTCH